MGWREMELTFREAMVMKTSEWQWRSGLVPVNFLIVSILGGISRNDSLGQLSKELIHGRCLRKIFKKQQPSV